MNMVLGRTQQIELSMNQIAADSNPEITFESADPKVAEVSEDGLVTAAGAGETQITVSVTLGDTTVKAITNVSVTGSLDETLVASYDFEGSLENGVEGGADASMLVTGLNSYVGQAAYDQGRDGQAVRLGDYGLKLNLNDLGTEYTVSMWVRSDEPLAGIRSCCLWDITTRKIGWPFPEIPAIN